MDSKKWKRTILYGITAVFVLLILFFLFFNRQPNRALKFWRTGNAEQTVANGGEAVEVDFPALNSDPSRYQNEFIRVSGAYQRPSHLNCVNPSGPAPRWALLNDTLSMEAIGFDGVLRLVSDGTPMIVEGIWRRYDGPLGCDKGHRAVAWYLETVRILSPNPLINGGNGGTTAVPTVETSDIALTPTTAAESPLPTIVPIETSRPIPSPTLSDSTLPTVTPLQPVDMTETAVAATLTGTPTSTPMNTVTPTPTATTEGDPTSTPTPTNTPRPAVTATSVNPGATSTPGNYPVPVSTSDPSAYD